MLSDFKCETSGKWILCGEHAVIRGKPALVFPFKYKQLRIKYQTKQNELSATFSGQHSDNLDLLFWNVMKTGFNMLNLSMETMLTGHFHLNNQIPIGAGLGASAALSVSISRWFIHQGLLEAAQCFSFSQNLENLFHRKSSGLDIAGCMTPHGVRFQQGRSEQVTPRWQPKWYLSFSGPIGITAHCVQQVETLFVRSPKKAQALDEQMHESVELAQIALSQNKSDHSLTLLSDAINLAGKCFEEWQLCNAKLQNHIDWLRNHGAIAVKPTGSGSGGYVLSLWKNEPPPDIQLELIAV